MNQQVYGQVRSGQVRSGQVRSGQVRSGQVRSGQVRSGQIALILAGIGYKLQIVVSGKTCHTKIRPITEV
jgi:hypothetical protein